jgi:histidyl-tRNA synthetase
MKKPGTEAAATETKDARTLARLPRGLADRTAAEIRESERMIGIVRAVYASYGFEPLETPAFEYTDALGKFLPDTDRPNAGVFSWKDDDDQWLSLRYDLTAPLARYVAQNQAGLPRPFRRYAVGPVWRNEKPGPGRFRQFIQCDADTVGADNIAADAEMCMLIADCLEALGIPRGGYVVKVNSRKVLDQVLDAMNLYGQVEKRLTVLRAIDKYDRLGEDGARALLGSGRKDESGDWTPGAGLDRENVDFLFDILFRHLPGGGWQHKNTIGLDRPIDDMFKNPDNPDQVFANVEFAEALSQKLGTGSVGWVGGKELSAIAQLCEAAGYGSNRIRIDTSIVRGLEYYTGPVFEAELTAPITDAHGQPVRFGAVASGGRYDGLVARFTGEKVPATGCSIGVSRLMAALALMHPEMAVAAHGPVVVLVMDKGAAELAGYQKMVAELRAAGIAAEMYLGSAGMKAQMKYADKRGSPVVVIEGGNERAAGEVTLKDLVEGAKVAAEIKDNKAWKEARPAQATVKRADLVAEVQKILARRRDA